MARRKISTTVYLEPHQDAGLKALKERTNVPTAEYHRLALDLLLNLAKGLHNPTPARITEEFAGARAIADAAPAAAPPIPDDEAA